MERLVGRRAKEIMEAAIKRVPLALPGRTQTARQIMQFKNLGAIAVHLAVATRGQTSYPCSNNDDRFGHDQASPGSFPFTVGHRPRRDGSCFTYLCHAEGDDLRHL